MSLKKSDKIIAIVGVIILIVAAVGIFLYTGEEEEEPTKPGEEKTIFEVVYEEIPMSALPDNQEYSIKPKIIGTASYEGVVEISEQNLKSVEIFVEYSDNKVGIFSMIGRLKFIGADTLTISVYDSQETEVGRESIKGSGNVTIPIDVDGSMISLEPIEAEDITEARDILEERYVDYHETYIIHITLKTGLWGKIREILSRDNFVLEVTYTYYDYAVVEKIPGDDDGYTFPPIGDEAGSQTYSQLAFPGKN